MPTAKVVDNCQEFIFGKSVSTRRERANRGCQIFLGTKYQK
jgi:hypothetical protein